MSLTSKFEIGDQVYCKDYAADGDVFCMTVDGIDSSFEAYPHVLYTCSWDTMNEETANWNPFLEDQLELWDKLEPQPFTVYEKCVTTKAVSVDAISAEHAIQLALELYDKNWPPVRSETTHLWAELATTEEKYEPKKLKPVFKLADTEAVARMCWLQSSGSVYEAKKFLAVVIGSLDLSASYEDKRVLQNKVYVWFEYFASAGPTTIDKIAGMVDFAAFATRKEAADALGDIVEVIYEDEPFENSFYAMLALANIVAEEMPI